jgi:hypothetical protein
MPTVYLFGVPGYGEQQVIESSDEAAVALLQERLLDEEQDPGVTVNAGMIISREQHPGLDEFAEKYTLARNHIRPNEDFPAGCMFETFGDEMEFVRRQQQKKIWTLVEEDGLSWLSAGFHFVNRLGYFVTLQEWQSKDEIYLYSS